LNLFLRGATPEASGALVFHADSIADDDHEEQSGENSSDNSRAGEQTDPVGHDKKDDWDLAVRFRDIQRYGYLEPKKKKEMSEQAIQAILVRARESLGPIQKPYRYQTLDARSAEEWSARGATSELDVEETLLQSEPMFQVRLERDHGLVLILDTSLSMKGEKLALLGVTVAAVCESVPADALCILGFDSEIHAIKEFSEKIDTASAIERTLSIPAGGFTNIERGLRAARERIEGSGKHQARVILVSDGRYTEGKNPVLEARNFRMIYPVKIGKDPGGRSVMREIADSGQGRFAEVREMHELPRFLLHAIRSWVK
jgi:Mg-chelatase subunit ChlD